VDWGFEDCEGEEGFRYCGVSWVEGEGWFWTVIEDAKKGRRIRKNNACRSISIEADEEETRGENIA